MTIDKFNFYRSYYEGIKRSSKNIEERLQAYEQIFEYMFDGFEPEEDEETIAFTFIKHHLKSSKLAVSNGSKGGEKSSRKGACNKKVSPLTLKNKAPLLEKSKQKSKQIEIEEEKEKEREREDPPKGVNSLSPGKEKTEIPIRRGEEPRFDFLTGFEEIWNIWGNYGKRPKALRAYQDALKIEKHEILKEQILVYLKSKVVADGKKMHLENYLEDECWRSSFPLAEKHLKVETYKPPPRLTEDEKEQSKLAFRKVQEKMHNLGIKKSMSPELRNSA